MIPIKGLQKTTLIDYPGKIACTIFLSGCNFRCGFCHNSHLVFNNADIPEISNKELLDFLEVRKDFLEGVCITGGEPTIYPELVNLCADIKKLGLSVKLDTNGTNPAMIQKLIDDRLVDYVAMDIKSSLSKYENITSTKKSHENIEESIKLIKKSANEYEFRTTVVPDAIDHVEMEKIGKLVDGSKNFFIQQFRPNEHTIDSKYNTLEPHSDDILKEFLNIMKKYAKDVSIRGS